ncbi:MAG TPA: hypothetical protein VK787_04270 [Puia sp.]|jgi:hypothetical protein|nr:hypothetical protein [Puia sp.]
MKKILIVTLLFCVFFDCVGQSESTTLKTKTLPDSYELSVPVSKLILNIPKNGLQEDLNKPPANGPRYFIFQDTAVGLIIQDGLNQLMVIKE